MNSEFKTLTLSNGIRCLHKQISSSVAYSAITINAGSRDEMPSEHGLAHFVEHCMFKGTKSRSSYDILNYVESRGGEINAFTSKEETVIHAVSLSEDIERAVDIISDLVFNPTFLQDRIDKEKKVVYDEQNSYIDSYPEAIYDDFEDLLFKNSTLGHNILGTKRRLKKFTTEDLISFVSRCYTTDQMVFSLSSSLDFSQFETLCNKYFAPIAPTTRGYERKQTLSYNKFNRKEEKGEAQVHYFLGTRSFSHFESQRIAAALMTNLIGGQSINSLLNVALREERGLTYSVEASNTPFCDTGIFSIYFTSDKKNLNECIAILKGIILKMQNEEFLREQLPSAKKQYQGQMKIAAENAENYMLAAARSLLIYNKVDSIEKMIERIDNLTVAEILEVSTKLFNDYSVLIYR